MLTLYATGHSLYCAKTRILLRHKALPFEEKQPPGGSGSDAYKQSVPSGNLPALIHNDLILSDSEAIAEYIEEAFPHPPMLPADVKARAKVRERSRFHDTRLEPALRKLFPLVKAGGAQRHDIDAAADGVMARLAQLGHMLDDPLVPFDKLTLGDCGFPVTFDWIDAICGGLKATVDWPPRIIGYRQWLHGFDSVSAELEQRYPVMRDWVGSYLY